MDHVVLTRFNLPSRGAESFVRAREGWLVERLDLFERYCLPSVLSQSNSNFSWLIYFDPESPGWLRERIDAHARAGYYVPTFRAEVSRSELLSDIAALFTDRGPELLTTSLDNDDALSSDFIQRLQSQPRPSARTVYYFCNGLVRSPTGLYQHRDRYNAFPSMRESWDGPMTCWADWHNRLSRHADVVEVSGSPGWLQVVHGGNVSNRTRGRLVSPQPYRAIFERLLDDVTPPRSSTLARDRFLGRPARVARDAGRTVAKNVALRLLGRGGFNRVKELLARSRRRPEPRP